ncbi:SGNH/GDSL hydrolase family protein [Cellulomonas sp. NS3]|uniref:SGNH/GDSL hydrolase family protein n=1 Tax=Cellulomonas sp. NS3 TaxID=2973977 RepID=UPI0021627F99|nr:SGNH/GDSL hydrolase family protein [Cellulomonas sp. NS3]
MNRNRVRSIVALGVGLCLIPWGAVAAPDAGGAADPNSAEAPSTDPTEAPVLVPVVPEERREDVLGAEWRDSGDRAWLLHGDADGLHVMVAEAAEAFAWRSVAALWEPGYDTDRWIGNACATASGERLVVTYAPRHFTNHHDAFLRGAFTAVVDLDAGTVTRLPTRASLEYFTPTCGYGEEALLTLSTEEGAPATRLVTVDAEHLTVAEPVDVEARLTSGVLTGAGLVASAGESLVRVADDGALETLVATTAVPFALTADADGGVVYADHDGTEATLHRIDVARVESPEPDVEVEAFASAPLTGLGVHGTVDGEVVLTGDVDVTGPLPVHVTTAEAPADAVPTMLGESTLDVTATVTSEISTEDDDAGLGTLSRVDVTLRNRATGESEELTASPDVDATAPDLGLGATGQADPAGTTTGVREGADALSRAAAEGAPPVSAAAAPTDARAGDPNSPIEAERTCSVPRNDPQSQAMQPKPRQVEWAVNQAIKNNLRIPRPANWMDLGMPAYSAQGLFPRVELDGGGEIPAQIVLGVLMQESNLWQASGQVPPGMAGNPLTGNYYGFDNRASSPDDRWAVRWSKSDCGYGVGQITDGMRLAAFNEVGKPQAYAHSTQRAIALDYTVNVALAVRMLAQKWNQTRAAGLVVNDGNPARIENWFFATWAYNSGFYPESAKATENRNGAWGVGWSNNPANPSYNPTRKMFGRSSADAAKPQEWPYPEKVMGWAAYPPQLLEAPEKFVVGYRQASWNGATTDEANARREAALPPKHTFCTTANDCYPGTKHTGEAPDVAGYDVGACAHRDAQGKYDGRCWFHGPVTWKADCSVSCGRGFIRFDASYKDEEQAWGDPYPGNCALDGLPEDALVVDDIADYVPIVQPGCERAGRNAGKFTLSFADDGGLYPSKSDFHQIGGGFNGHFWFGHTRTAHLRGGTMQVEGSWELDDAVQGWTRVFVHMPDLGAHTQQAVYTIHTGVGAPQQRVLLQRTLENRWVSLGVFEMQGRPKVTLTTTTRNGDSQSYDPNGTYVPKSEDIAFDAVAFQTLDAKPRDIVVALGDSYSSGEGASAEFGVDYYRETDNNGGKPLIRNACHRSPFTWSRVATLPDRTQSVGELLDDHDETIDYQLLACSGARVHNVLANYTVQLDDAHYRDAWNLLNSGMYGEVSQIDRGFLTSDTTLVTLSIGGNDAKFSDVLQKCHLDLIETCQKARLGTDTDPMEVTIPQRIEGPVKDSVVTALRAIHDRAPNARVVLMGYPELLSRDGFCAEMIGPSEAVWLNGLADTLADSMFEAVAIANSGPGPDYADFADPRREFDGIGVCGTPETIHGLVLGRTPGDRPFTESPISAQSFHPKIEGYEHYATVLERTLAGDAG